MKRSNYLRGASVRLQCLSKEVCLSREASLRQEHLSAYNAQRNEHAYQEEHLSERSNCSPAMLVDRPMPIERSIIPKGPSVRLPCFGSLRPKAKKTSRAGSAQMMQARCSCATIASPRRCQLRFVSVDSIQMLHHIYLALERARQSGRRPADFYLFAAGRGSLDQRPSSWRATLRF